MLKNMNLSTRLLAGFGTMTILLLILTGIGIWGMASINENMERIVKVNSVRINLVGALHDEIGNIGINMRNLIINDDPEKKKEYNQRIVKSREEYARIFKQVEEMTNKNDTKSWEIISRLNESINTTRGLNNKVIELAFANQDKEAGQFLSKQAAPAERAIQAEIDKLLHHNMERNEMRHNEAIATYQNSRNLMIGLGVAAIITAILTATVLIRTVLRQLGGDPREVAEAANYVAVGDLSHEIKLTSGDTTSVMAAMKRWLRL